MVRLLISFISIFILSTYPAKSQKKKQVDIYYLPHIHKVFNAKGYQAMGGDAVFFSYLFIANEILKNPNKFELYVEGYYRDIYRGSKYRLRRKFFRKARKVFPKGFPKHISEWTQKQKTLFVEYGPVTLLYLLRKVRRIRAADIWTSKRKLLRSVKGCADKLKVVGNITYSKEYTNWEDYYAALKKAYKKKSNKKCSNIFSRREKYVVRRLKRHRRIIRKPLLILYGYAHDFGSYFNGNIKYIGTPAIEYAAVCYAVFHTPKESLTPGAYNACASRFKQWLEQLGLTKYFSGEKIIRFSSEVIDRAEGTRRPISTPGFRD